MVFSGHILLLWYVLTLPVSGLSFTSIRYVLFLFRQNYNKCQTDQINPPFSMLRPKPLSLLTKFFILLLIQDKLTLCLLFNFSCVFVFCRFFSKSTFSKNYIKNTIRVSYSLDPIQADFVGPELGPNCLQRLSAEDTRKQRMPPSE